MLWGGGGGEGNEEWGLGCGRRRVVVFVRVVVVGALSAEAVRMICALFRLVVVVVAIAVIAVWCCLRWLMWCDVMCCVRPSRLVCGVGSIVW